VSRNVLRYLGTIGAASALVLAASACGSSNNNSGSGSGGGSGGGGNKNITLGFVGAQTGPDAQLGINISNGVQLAINQHNAKSGVTKVKYKAYDTQGDPTQASSQVRKVIEDKVVGVIGPAFSGESKTALPILEQAKIPNISPSATAVALGQQGYKYWHRVLANDDVQGPGDADFMANTLKAKKVAVIDDQSEYGKGLGDAVRGQLKKDGVTVGPSDKIDPDGSDYSSTVNEIKAANPNAVFFAGYYSAAAKLVKQLRDAGVTATFMSGDGSQDQKLADQAGKEANGALLSCTCSLAVGSSDPAVKKFDTDYQAKYGSAPSTYSSEGFDAANIFLQAIDAGKTTPDAINNYLKTVNYQGVSKPIKFSSNGELQNSLLFISEIVNGKLTYLGDAKSVQPKASS
jgi:branched-chain amino acid transport system substrate-binding protein